MGGAIQRRRLPTEQQHDHSIIDQRGKDACGLEALTRSHFTALRRRLEVYPSRSAKKQQGRKNSHNGVPGNLLDELVDNNRPVYKDRYARNSSWPGALCPTKRPNTFAQTCLLALSFFLAVGRRTIHSRPLDRVRRLLAPRQLRSEPTDNAIAV